MVDNNETNIQLNIETAGAIASLRKLQAEISTFHQQMAKGGAAANQQAAAMQQNLINTINKTGAFQASMSKVASSTDAFTTALEKNKLTMGQTFKHILGSSKTFGKQFSTEFDTITNTARERVKDLQTQYIKLGKDANGAIQSIKVRPLVLDLKDLETQTMMTAQKQQILNKLISQGSTQLLNWGKNTQWAGRQLMVGFTVPLTMLGTVAAQTFMEIEKEVIRVQRVYGDFSTSVQETNDMVASLREVALEFTKWGVSVKDTMSLAAEAAATGKTGQELIAQVSEATRLAVLGNVDQAQALETTMSVTNAFGISADKLASKIDFLNAVENQSVTSIEDLTVAIPKAAPVIQQLGGNVEDLAFFLTAMKEGGIDAAEGANALKSGLASMINPTKSASDFLASFGINLKGIVDTNKGDVKGMVVEFAQALDTLDPLNRAQAIEQLFGKFQFARMSTLFQNVIAQGSQAQRVLQLTNASAGELAILSQRELSKVEESTTFKFQSAMERFQAALAPVGEQFLKAVTPIIEFGTKLLEQFNGWSEGSKQFAVIATAVIGGIGPVLLMAVGLVANGVANLIKLFQFMGRVFAKSGMEAKVLGSDTEYMTQAQIEAAAAASSLGQTHSKLPQIFTAEKAALDQLIISYQRATAAQNAMGGYPGGSRGKGAKKYASGVVSVPGPKGKGDVVPAMLSPGEAVIPADMVQKYGPLIQGMVADSIPGYEQGIVEFNGKSYPTNSPGTAIKIQDMIKEAQSFGSVIDNVDDVITEALDSAASNVKQGAKLTQAAVKESMKTARGGALHLARSTSAAQPIAGGNAGVVAAHGTPGKDLTAKEAQKLGQSILKEMPNSAVGQMLATTMDKVKMLSNLTFPMPAAFNQGKMTGTESADWIKQDPARFTEMIAKQHKMDPNDPGLIAFGKAVARDLEKAGARAITEGEFEDIVKKNIENASESAAKKALIKSRDTQTVAQIANPNRGRHGVQRENLPPGYTGLTAYRSQNIKGHNEAADQFVINAANERAGSGTVTNKDMSAKQKRDARNARRRQLYAAKKTQVPTQSDLMAEVTPTEEPTAKKPGVASRAADSIKRNGKGIAGMALMSAGMIPGLQNLAGPLAGLGTALMFLPGPAAAAVAALGLVGYGIFKMVDNMNKAKQAGLDAANAMSMTTEKLQGLSEMAGTVSATELRRQEQAARVAGPQTESQKAFGQTFLESEQGKAMISDVAVQRGMGSSSAAIGKNLGLQLSEAVAQGVLSAEQAKSIAINLGDNLKDYQLSLNMEGKINEIIGPNGENLAKDPLKVTLAIQQGSLDNIANATQGYQTGQQNPATAPGTLRGVAEVGTSGAIAAASKTVQEGTKKLAVGVAEKVGISIAEKFAASAALQVGAAALAPETLGVSLAVLNIGLAIWGIVDGVNAWNEASAENAKLASSAVQAYTNAYSQSIGMRDVLNQQYDNQIATLQANYQNATTEKERQGILEEMKQVENDRAYALDLQSKKQSEIMQSLVAQKDLLGGAYNDALKSNLETVYKDNEASKEAALSILEQINAMSVGNKGEATYQTTLQMQLASGELDPFTMKMILEAGANSTQFKMNYLIALQQSGDAKVIELMQKLFSAGAGTEATNVAIGFAAKDPTAMNSILTAIDTVKALQATGGIKLDINTGSGQKKLMDTANLIKDLSAQKKKLNFDILYKVTGNKDISKAIADNKQFAKLPKNLQVQYAATYTAVLDAKGDPSFITAFKNWLQFNPNKTWNDFAAFIAGNQASTAQAAYSGSASTEQPKTGGGGGSSEPKKSAAEKRLDALNKKLDKQQKALNVIALLEDEVNKKYEERQKALEKIAQLNSRIADQQRGQMNIADALSKGDIAGAAMAIQEERSRAAERAAQDQAAAMEMAKQAELDAIEFDGLSREELEASMHSLELDIAKLEYELAGKKAADQPSGGGGGGGGSSVADTPLDVTTDVTTGVDVPQSDWISDFGNGVETMFTETIPNWWNDTMSAIGTGWNNAMSGIETWWNDTMSAIGTGWNNAMSGIGNVWDTYVAQPIDQWWKDLMNNPFVQGIGAIFSGTASAFDEYVFAPIQQGLSDVGTAVSGWWDEKMATLENNWKIWTTNLSNGWTTTMETISTNWETKVVQPIKTKMDEIGAWWETNVVQTIKTKMDEISSWWGTNVVQPVNAKMAEIGAWWGENVTEPIKTKMDEISSWWGTNVIDPIKEKINEISTWWQTNVTDPLKKSWNTFMSWLGGDKTAEQKASDVKAAWKTAFDGVKTWWTVDLPNGIKTAWDNVVATVKRGLNVAIDALNKIGKIKMPGSIFGIPLPPGVANASVQLWNIPRFAKGGMVPGFGSGDTVPAMLTPGEFVVRQPAVENFGASNLKAINNGTFDGGSVYNYSVTVNASGNASADDIANAVMNKLKTVEDQRMRSSRV